MPIEIHSSKDIDNNGEERTRPLVVPQPVVRPRDWCYISQPEHLEALLHLKVFRTSTPHEVTRHRLIQQELQGEEVHDADLPTTRAGRGVTFSSVDEQRMDRKLLGKEFLDSQKNARILLKEQSKKRHTKQVVSNRIAMQDEIKRQEAALARVLGEIKVSTVERDKKRATEKGVITKIESSTVNKVGVSLGKPMQRFLTPKKKDEAVAWALQAASQPDAVMEKELYSLLVEIKKFMSLFNGAKSRNPHPLRREHSRSDSKSGLMSMLENLQPPGEDDHLTFEEKLAKQETIGYSRFIHAISPAPPGSHLRRTIHKHRKTFTDRKTKFQPSKLFDTIQEAVNEKKSKGCTAPAFGNNKMAQLSSPRNNKQRPLSARMDSQTSKDNDKTTVNSSPIPPTRRPSTSGGHKFSRASRMVINNIKDAKSPAMSKLVPTTVPLVFNTASAQPTQKRSMSVMSVQINAAGEEEDVIMTKLYRVEGGSGQENKKQQSSVSDGGIESVDEDDTTVIEEEEEEAHDEEADHRLDEAATIKRYTNNPEYKWNSKDCYHFNDIFGVDEFHEGAVKHFNKLFESREATLEENRRVIADMADESNKCIDNLIGHFVKHHELGDSLLASMVHKLAQKDFDRPDMMRRITNIIYKKVDAGELHKHVLDELREINAAVASNMHSQHMRNLLHNKWFLRIVNNLQEYKKKTKSQIAKSLIKFLVASCKLLENRWTIDEALFYELIEHLLSPGDQKDVIVHRSLSIYREKIGISSEQYAAYLEGKKIPPCPELLVEVRDLQMKRDRQLRVIQTKEENVATSPQTVAVDGPEISTRLVTTVETRTGTADPVSKMKDFVWNPRLSESAPTTLFG